jgi:phosphoglucosamine mutase
MVCDVFPSELVNVPLGVAPAADVVALPAVCAAVAAAESAMGGEGRVLLRPSGTEPLIRVMVEGRDTGEVDASRRRPIAAVVRDAVGG